MLSTATRRIVALGSGLLATTAFLSARRESALAQDQPQELSQSEWRKFKLVEIEPLNHNSSIFRFALSNPEAEVNLPVASCLSVRANIDGKDVARPYTPITPTGAKGHMDLLIKTYPNGNLSKHIFNMKTGEEIEMQGPWAKIQYKPNAFRNIGMIAGGTGIAPMLQVIQETLRNPEDKTNISLIFANVAEEDILLKDKLDSLAAKHSNFKVHYVLEKAPQGWTGSQGYVNTDIAKSHLPRADEEGNMVFVCGPPPMMNAISGQKKSIREQGEVSGLLKDLGFTPANVFKF
eukprot:TRINITY_DN1236_c0_g1_i1.p1 TRINITY_DN1236_c0_g1~~TRINITY_DN1236_c0_g1_i1.p1  ORF type:complete len:291 (+),score=130.12 TRINITY_DN1236_c0_g1_i1:67-939(+)